MGRVIHFEWATTDPAREIDFFKSLFGWKIEPWGEAEYWLVDTGEEAAGINGAIMQQQMAGQPRVVNTVGVEDLDDSIAKAIAAGATVELEKQEVPGVGWTAYLLSPTGIMFGMIQPLPGDAM